MADSEQLDTYISLEPNASPDDVAIVRRGLRAFNVEVIGPPNEEEITIFLRTGSGQIIGGLLGDIRWRWMYVARIWIDAAYRGQGHGASLMRAAEVKALDARCLGIHLDTFEYQARPFYEKLGYEVFGTLEGYPPGYRQYYLAKRLDSGDVPTR